MNTNHDELGRLFREACELDSSGRKSLLNNLSQELRDELNNLLEHDEPEAQGLPITITGNDLPLQIQEQLRKPKTSPERIGPYKILQKLGEGGMGIVYLADQEEPIRRRVALKILKPGLDSGEVLARFESERQALSLMNHPNIARVLDARTTDQGHPYFVMDYIQGLSLLTYCDSNQLDIKRRLQLFLQICSAVQHAHATGILHRDLKPSNVLVPDKSGEAIPKLIDFGLAKALGQELTDKTLFTRRGIFLGTPGYMSPEQADLSGLDIDARTDVYSLGAMLYELLVGVLPLELGSENLGYGEVRRIICEEDPIPMSLRLSADRENGDKSSLRLLRGDLDWIALKALSKKPDDRYQTVAELKEDIQRHLNQEPVRARPPTLGYRLRKIVYRNKVITAAVLGAFFTLVPMLIIIGYLVSRLP